MQATEQQTQTLGTLLQQLKQKRGIKRADLYKAAQISPLTWDKIISEQVPDIIKRATPRKQKAWIRILTRLATLCEVEPEKLFALAGLSVGESAALTAKELISEKASEYVMRHFVLQSGDLEFLQKLQGELRQPLTFGLAYELLKRRR